jgi:hypothetical protein
VFKCLIHRISNRSKNYVDIEDDSRHDGPIDILPTLKEGESMRPFGVFDLVAIVLVLGKTSLSHAAAFRRGIPLGARWGPTR